MINEVVEVNQGSYYSRNAERCYYKECTNGFLSEDSVGIGLL